MNNKIAVRYNLKIYNIRIDALQLTAVMCLSRDIIRKMLAVVLAMVGMSSTAVLLADVLIYSVILLLCFKERTNLMPRFTVFFITCAAYFAISLAFHPDYYYWYTRPNLGAIYTVFRPDHGALWAIMAIELSETAEKAWNNLRYYAYALGLYNMYLAYGAWKSGGIWYSYNALGIIDGKDYSLGFGYDMAFIATVFMLYGFQNRSHFHKILAVASWAMMLVYGSRGALLCTAAFLLLFVLSYNSNKYIRVIMVIGVIAVILSFAFQGDKIIVYAATFIMQHFGIRSRTITAILQGRLSENNGRTWIYETAIRAIREKPWLGYGAFGDRPFIAPKFIWGYCHNIVLEMWFDFGIIIGSAILVFLAVKTVLTYFNSDRAMKNIIIVCVSALTKLVISDSFWSFDYFWILVASIFILNNKYREVYR